MRKVFKALLIFNIFFLTLFHFDGLSREYVIGFGSCLHQDYPQPIWGQVNKQSPNLFIMLGDNVYGDRSEEHTSELQSPCNPRMPSSA